MAQSWVLRNDDIAKPSRLQTLLPYAPPCPLLSCNLRPSTDLHSCWLRCLRLCHTRIMLRILKQLIIHDPAEGVPLARDKITVNVRAWLQPLAMSAPRAVFHGTCREYDRAVSKSLLLSGSNVP